MDRSRNLNFKDYLKQARQLITDRRTDLHDKAPAVAESIITANCPYELVPSSPIKGKKTYRYGVLLIHGLLDSPFSFTDLGMRLAKAGIFCRSVLLPGHGTKPEDLGEVSYHDWREVVQYGVNSLKAEVDHIYIAGFSTGAVLAVQQALLDKSLAGLILLAPAIDLRGPAGWVPKLHRFKKLLGRERNPWAFRVTEKDYVKYQSIMLNAVTQVHQLIHFIVELRQTEQLDCPVFLVVSQDDETISSKEAIHFFKNYDHMLSQLILYCTKPYVSSDKRFIIRSSHYQQLNIKNFSHICIPFAPTNPHYGQQGDYQSATKNEKSNSDVVYGAYNYLEILYYNMLYDLKLVTKKRKILTYNPDFDFMSDAIIRFIKG